MDVVALIIGKFSTKVASDTISVLPECPGEDVTAGVTPGALGATGRTVNAVVPAVIVTTLLEPAPTKPPSDLTGPEKVVFAMIFLHTKLSLSVVYASAGAV